MKNDNLKHETPTDANNVLAAGLSTLKGYYVIGNRTGCSQPETIHFQRKGVIERFLKETDMAWEECQKYGWCVYKVNVAFEPCR